MIGSALRAHRLPSLAIAGLLTFGGLMAPLAAADEAAPAKPTGRVAEDPQVTSEAFIKLIVQGKVEEGYDWILGFGNELLRRQEEGRKRLIEETKVILQSQGAPLAGVLVQTKIPCAEVISYQYLLKFKHAPIALTLTWYRGASGHILLQLQRSLDFSEIFAIGAANADVKGPERELAEACLKTLASGDTAECLKMAFAQGTEPVRANEKIRIALVGEAEKFFAIYGRPGAATALRAQKVGEDLVQLQYLVKCPSHPLIWTFRFYRATDKMELIGVMFNDQLHGILAR